MRLRHWKALGILCAVIAVTAGIVAFPTDTAEAARNGLLLCAQVIIPSLFPFFVLSGVVIETGLVHWIGRALEGVMRPIFRVNGAGATALALGVIGGYPVGATCAISLYEKRLCTKTEAERLLGFCNNSGPGFILGAVGIGIFLDMRVGILLYGIHILACLLTGFLFRFYRYGDRPGALRGKLTDTGAPLSSRLCRRCQIRPAIQLEHLCIYRVFCNFDPHDELIPYFPALASLLAPLTGLSADFLCQVLNGMLEVTTGLSSLTATGGSLLLHIIAAAFSFGLGGHIDPLPGALLYRRQRLIPQTLFSWKADTRRIFRSFSGAGSAYGLAAKHSARLCSSLGCKSSVRHCFIWNHQCGNGRFFSVGNFFICDFYRNF